MFLNKRFSNFKFSLALLTIIPMLSLGACGFKPLYSQNQMLVGNIIVKPAEGRLGFLVEQELKAKIGNIKSANKSYILNFKITKTVENSNLRVDFYTTRSTLIASVDYELSQTDGKIINGNVVSRAGFDAIEKAYSEVSLNADTEERLAREIADKIWQDLLIKSHR